MTVAQRTEAILASLNASQRQAVQTIDGPLMTLAGPGSGKTRVVTHRIAYMIDQGIPSHSILALTFTNKAASEIRERVHALVGSQALTMGTFHGFGARFLRRYGSSVGLRDNFTIYDTDDSRRVLERAIAMADVRLSHFTPAQIAKEISRLKSQLITPEFLEPHRLNALESIVHRVYPVYQQLLLAHGAVDFDDLLLHPTMILRTEPELRASLDEKYRYILVDEYQDTNQAQYLMLKGLSIDFPNLNVTGDPDQSIYGWRGANIENILTFERDFQGAQVIRLEENYRSTPQILSVADAVIAYNRRRKEKVLVPNRPSGNRVRLVYYRSDHDEANLIADQIKSAIIDHGARPSDFAILYRTNAQSRLFEKALLQRRLNYQLIGGFRFYHRQEIKDLLAYLRLLYNPYDDVAFERVINTPPRGLGDKTIEKIAHVAQLQKTSMLEALFAVVQENTLSKKAQNAAKSFLKLYHELLELSTGRLLPLVQHLIKTTDYLAYLAKKNDDAADESSDENVQELLADVAQLDEQCGDENRLERFLEQVSLLSDADNLQNSPDRVTLMTLHASKGLEFKVIYIVAIEQNVLPHIRSSEDPSQIEEERRLFFVGITRARDRLQLSAAARRGLQNRTSIPSQFLMEVPRLELEVVGFNDHWEETGDPGFDEDFGGGAEVSFPDDPIDLLEEGEVDASVDWMESRRGRKHPLGPANERAEQANPQPSLPQHPKIVGNIPAELDRQLRKLGRSDMIDRIRHASSLVVVTTSGVDVSLFHPGSRVRHPKYQLGEVVSVDGHGAKRRALVRFDSGESSTFVLKSSPLVLEDSP